MTELTRLHVGVLCHSMELDVRAHLIPVSSTLVLEDLDVFLPLTSEITHVFVTQDSQVPLVLKTLTSALSPPCRPETLHGLDQ